MIDYSGRVEHRFEEKIAGVLVPIFALRGKEDPGIGDLAALREVVDWAADSGIRAIQVLPVNEPGSDHSPYNLLSSMALDPVLLDVSPGALPGLSDEDREEIGRRHAVDPAAPHVDYVAVSKLKRELLERACSKFRRTAAFTQFEEQNAGWLDSYSLFRAVMEFNGGSEVSDEWPKPHRKLASARKWVALLPGKKRKAFEKRIRFFRFIQWVAFRQWMELRAHADRRGVFLIGDVPVGVSIYSADVWSAPRLFDLQRSSGAPPEKVFRTDAFTAKWGQNWGFPLYNWDVMESENYTWWRQRLRWLLSIFHYLRVDHALGFFRIYSFPWRPADNGKFTDLDPGQAAEITGGPLPEFVPHDDDSEENRAANQRHGEKILRLFLEESGPGRILAEDLGEVAPYVRPTLAQLHIPGFKIPQWERTGDRLTPGVSYPRESLTTFATHDHPPLKSAWLELVRDVEDADPEKRDQAIHSLWELMDFCARPDMKLPQDYTPEIHHTLLRGLLLSNSWLAVHMITDVFGSDLRFNVPGSESGLNWSARIPEPVSEWNEKHAGALDALRSAIRETGRDPLAART